LNAFVFEGTVQLGHAMCIQLDTAGHPTAG
jgi:hypothetical protein